MFLAEAAGTFRLVVHVVHGVCYDSEIGSVGHRAAQDEMASDAMIHGRLPGGVVSEDEMKVNVYKINRSMFFEVYVNQSISDGVIHENTG